MKSRWFWHGVYGFILLALAVSIYAASRTVDNPTHKKLKALIDTLVDARIDDHQLDDTDLTFRDISKVKLTFLNLLVGQFHARVKYPGDEDTEEKDAEVSAGDKPSAEAAAKVPEQPDPGSVERPAEN